MLDLKHGCPIQPLLHPLLTASGVKVSVLREDLNHPSLPGNKARKLNHNLLAAKQAAHHTLLTFGGAFSNHIRATAAAGRLCGFKTVGIIRGERVYPLNPVLGFAASQSMSLQYLDRTTYRAKSQKKVLERLVAPHSPCYVLPEGGTNALAVKGVAELVTPEIAAADYDVLYCACGTGGTLAGLVAGLGGRKKAIGVAVLKGGSFLREDVARLLVECGCEELRNWEVDVDHHCGGYAKRSPELESFLADMDMYNPCMPMEATYMGRVFYAVMERVRVGGFKSGTSVLVVHTGGWGGGDL